MGLEVAQDAASRTLVVDGPAWREGRTFRPFDEAVEGTDDETLVVVDDASRVATTAAEILTRYQRHVRRRNEASADATFDAVLAAHEHLHDRGKPLVAADFDHALDTWQWTLRLRPDARAAVQLAALFHDIERLVSEADRRVEQHAPDYQAFKDAHARAGAAWAREVLLEAGCGREVADRTASIIERHERRAEDDEVLLLNDADALSFFALNSPGYVDYFGLHQATKKVAYTWNRLGPVARAELAKVRLRRDVRALVDAHR